MSEQDSTVNRRRFIQQASVAGFAAMFSGCGDDKKPPAPPPGNPAPVPRATHTPTPNDIKQEKLDELYADIREHLRVTVEATKNEGKRLVLLVAGDHLSKESVLMQMILVRAARDVDPEGVGSVLMTEGGEYQQEKVAKLKNYRNFLHVSEVQGNPSQIITHAYAMHDLKMPTGFADDDATQEAIRKKFSGTRNAQGQYPPEYYDLLEKNLATRDQAIAREMNERFGKGGIGSIGQVHVKGVLKGLMEDKKNMVAVVGVGIEMQITPEMDHSPNHRDALRYYLESEDVSRLGLTFDPDLITLPEMPDMLEKAVQHAPEIIKQRNASQRGRQ